MVIRCWNAACRATKPPVIAAVRVPPSACSTSQSTLIWRSPKPVSSVTARNDRPISRWICVYEPDCLPLAASRSVRVEVERGSIPYSAVTQPRPVFLRKGGTCSSIEAVQRTCVSPNSGKAGALGMLGHMRLEDDRAQRIGARPAEGGNGARHLALSGISGRGRHYPFRGCLASTPRAAIDGWGPPHYIPGHPAFQSTTRGLCHPTRRRSGDLTAGPRNPQDRWWKPIEIGDPIGSRTISRKLGLTLSPATIRNVMADLEDRDCFMRRTPRPGAYRPIWLAALRPWPARIGSLTQEERASIDGRCRAAGKSFAEVLEQARRCSPACPIARAWWLRPGRAATEAYRIRQIGPGRALVVLVAEAALSRTASSSCRWGCHSPRWWRQETT